jgi:medium-chain acyl-[acyl-carrier-protein] hydrolase
VNPSEPFDTDEPGDADEKLTLYCLAHAGGSAIPYTRWKTFLPPSVRIAPLELPGHGARLREPLLRQPEPLVAELTRTIREQGPGRFALYGHSFGSVLAFETARALTRLGSPPAALLASGRNGPSQPLSHRPIHRLPDDDFIASLSRYGGMPRSLLDQPELLRLYLPALWEDLEIVETYERRHGPAIDAPVTAFAGRRDSLTDPAGLVSWERETTGTFELVLIAGGHFFLDEPEFRAVLSARLSRLVPAAGRPEDGNAEPAAVKLLRPRNRAAS